MFQGRIENKRLVACHLSGPLLFDRVLDLEKSNIQLNRRFCIGRCKLISEHFGDDFTTFLNQRFLASFILGFSQLIQGAGKVANPRESLDNGKRCLCGLFAFENRGQHVEAFLRESFRQGCRLAD